MNVGVLGDSVWKIVRERKLGAELRHQNEMLDGIAWRESDNSRELPPQYGGKIGPYIHYRARIKIIRLTPFII